MTVWAAVANGNLTSSSTWEQVDATSYSNSESGNTAVTTSLQYSSTFTPGAITIDGVAIKLASRAASPSGTVTIGLYLSSGSTLVASVTVNISDLPTCSATSGTTTPVATAEGGWFFVNFGSTLLITATAYKIGIISSSSSQLNVWTNGTGANWSRYLRTTTTGAPSAGDDLIITGEWTAAATVTARAVTMDATAATAYGSNTTSQVTPSCSICNNGTLTFGTSASTAYIFNQLGHVVVYNGGTLNVGTSGTPVPGTSTVLFEFQCTNAGDFGLVARNGSAVNMYGVPRTGGSVFSWTKLTANLSASGTSLTTSDSTGWLSGDVIAIASTDQTASHIEKKILSGNASGTAISITVGVTNAHSGTSPTQAEVALLTRNVVFTSEAATKQSFFYIGPTATVNCQWIEFSFLSPNVAGKYGLYITTTTGTCAISYCSIHDCATAAFYATGASLSNFTFTYNVLYNNNTANSPTTGIQSATSGTWTIDHCVFMGPQTFTTNLLLLADVGGTLTNNVFTSCQLNGGALSIDEANIIGTFSSNVFHANTYGPSIDAAAYGTLTSFTSYRNSNSGVRHNFASNIIGPITWASALLFGNGSAGAYGQGASFASMVLDTCTICSDSTFTQTNGLLVSLAGVHSLFNCSFSVASGIYTANTIDISFNTINAVRVFADDCIFDGVSVFGNITALTQFWPFPFLQIENFDQTANDNRAYYATGGNTPNIVKSNSSILYSTNSLSEQMVPGTAAFKTVSASKFSQVKSGKKITPTVQIWVDASYSGNAPRLVVKRSDSLGVSADTVLATWSGSTGTWVPVSAQTVAAAQDGVFEFVVDCDGAAGNVYVGDFAAVSNVSGNSLGYWSKGRPFAGLVVGANSIGYWQNGEPLAATLEPYTSTETGAGALAFSGIALAGVGGDVTGRGTLAFAGISIAGTGAGLIPTGAGVLSFGGISLAGVGSDVTGSGELAFDGISIEGLGFAFSPPPPSSLRQFWTF